MMTFTIPEPAASIPAAPLRCQVVTAVDELASLRPEWEELLARSSANEPMLSPHWLLPWWDVYGKSTRRQLRVGCFYEGSRLIGLALLQSRRVWYRRCIPFQRLEPLGADVDEGDGVCSEYLNLIIQKGKEPHVLSHLMLALLSGEFGRWHELVIGSMPGDSLLPALLSEACAATGLRTETQAQSVSPYIPLPASWDDYLKALGKNKRYVVKSLRDFETWAEGQAVFHRAADPEQLAQGKRILQALHAERWQEAGRDGAFHAGRFAAFHDLAMAEFLKAGALDLHWLSVRGEPMAAVYSLRWHDKIHFYQSGRKMDVPNNIRLGIVLHAHCIRHAIDSGCREYDFLAGLSQYKQQLSLAQRPIVRFRAVRPGWREKLRCLGERGVDLGRRIRNALRPKSRQVEKPADQ